MLQLIVVKYFTFLGFQEQAVVDVGYLAAPLI